MVLLCAADALAEGVEPGQVGHRHPAGSQLIGHRQRLVLPGVVIHQRPLPRHRRPAGPEQVPAAVDMPQPDPRQRRGRPGQPDPVITRLGPRRQHQHIGIHRRHHIGIDRVVKDHLDPQPGQLIGLPPGDRREIRPERRPGG